MGRERLLLFCVDGKRNGSYNIRLKIGNIYVGYMNGERYSILEEYPDVIWSARRFIDISEILDE